MAQIMKIEDFVHEYNKILSEEKMDELMSLKPGENDVVAFGKTRSDDVVFVRVTKHHMATMSVYEFNGINIHI